MDRHLAAHRPHDTVADDAGTTANGEPSELASGKPTSTES
jgi:hypothetical protein